jgi:hypothetical protein
MSFRRKATPPDPRIPRPTTFEAGRALILKTFVENKWTDRDVRVYLETKDADIKTPAGVETVLDAMAESRMILFTQENEQ